ncbi:MAG: CAP domain-containing protein [Solirubrobacterales bacterium]
MTWRRRKLVGGVALAAAWLLTFLGVQAGTAVSATPCPFQGAANGSTSNQEKAVLCLVNRARASRGLDPLGAPGPLGRAADRKSADILRCDEFSHEACGREFTYWIERSGYGGCSWGENIAYASGGYATPRRIFGLWMHSAGHRRNILGSFTDIGIGLRVGQLDGAGRVHVWTQEFGSRDC